MNLRYLSDQDLLSATERIMQQERAVLTSLLHHLREVERRRLYADLKYGSLFEYTVKKLGYPEDQAARRLAAMRLLQELPEIEDKISSGALNLTQLGMARSFFKREEKAEAHVFSRQEKIELLQELENKSIREPEKAVLARSSNPIAARPDKIRPITEELVEVRFVADEALQKKLERLKNLKSHKNPHMSLSDLVHELCDLALTQWDRTQTAASRSENGHQHAKASLKQTDAEKKTFILDKTNVLSRPYLPIAVKREVWRHDRGCCTQCGSQYQVEIDHIRPYARGGSSELKNLRLLCRSCNQRAAIVAFGFGKIDRYINKAKIKHQIIP